MNKIYKVLHYFTLIMFKRGMTLSYNLTWRCNLKCPYCAVMFPTGKNPKAEREATMKEILENIDTWKKLTGSSIKQIQFSGGSPELHADFVDIVNYLLDKGYFVHVNSNLTYLDKLMQIKPSRRFLIVATYHHSLNPYVFETNYNKLSQRYQIMVSEIQDELEYKASWHKNVTSEKVFKFSRSKPLTNEFYMKRRETMIRMNPDLTKIALSCWNACL